MHGRRRRILELEVEVVDGASARPVREEEQDAEEYGGREERCHRPHDARVVLGAAGEGVCISLKNTGRYEEAKSLLREVLPEALRTFGPDHDTTLVFRRALVRTVLRDPESSLAELRQAEADLRDVSRRTRRVFGTSHPESANCEALMGQLKATIAARNSGDA